MEHIFLRTRRTVLKTAGFASFVRALAVIEQSASGASAGSGINWNELMERLNSLSADTERLLRDDQELCVARTAKALSNLAADDSYLMAVRRLYRNDHSSSPWIHTVAEKKTFEVKLLTFEPGDFIPLHDHPRMTGVSMCISGHIEVDNYDLNSEAREDGIVMLRKHGHTALAARDICTLTEAHGNIHGLRASTFSEVIDIFTPPYDAERLTHSHWYEPAAEPARGSGRDAQLIPAKMRHF